ncbi:putative lipopolysaccharide heptosyltransferase III [Pokkaliibacter sp. MBI-7]|uniref:putative lipopolysaccharide heptosyltransferase III n=1 Tax=Pokkaliibacter sp. MBI-7 TaxID=3040600 RepID=UPI00244A8045|nr:putative lipopolysaccharide heptosyltransferase III [Pokkaliibacter sp. MBI-7]MDH2432240.1 putative lipopolysaccharide heptosyltransferase III [Pokkaliibacter sp. MBI-7]
MTADSTSHKSNAAEAPVLVHSAQSRHIDLKQLNRVLVIMLRHHGDVLLTSPVFSTLKNHYPHLQIDALVYADTSPMLKGHPAISQLHLIDRRWKKQGGITQLKGEWQLLRQLRQRHFDLTLHLTPHWRGAWLNRLLRPRYALVPDFQKDKRNGALWRGSFTDFYPYQAGAERHTVDKNLEAVRYLGIEPGAADSRLLLCPGEEAQASALAHLQRHHVDTPYILVHPTSRWLFKCWEEQALAETLDHLASQGWPLVLTAAPDPQELAMVERILARLHIARPVNLAGQLNLQELAALIAGARAYLGVDSVPMHIAAAMQTPSVALFGPSQACEWGPWQAPGKVISSRDFPRPTGEVVTNSKYRHSLINIPSSAVIKALEDILA